MKRKKQQKKSRRLKEKEHAKKRFLQRFGEELSTKDLKYTIKRIQSNDFVFLEKQSCRVTKFFGRVKDNLTVIVYDNYRQMIITFLKPEWVNYEIDEIQKSVKDKKI